MAARRSVSGTPNSSRLMTSTLRFTTFNFLSISIQRDVWPVPISCIGCPGGLESTYDLIVARLVAGAGVGSALGPGRRERVSACTWACRRSGCRLCHLACRRSGCRSRGGLKPHLLWLPCDVFDAPKT